MKKRFILLGASALVSTQVAPAQITSDLVAYYDFEDLSNDPAASGPALTESATAGHTIGVAGGKVGNAVEFTGTTNNFLNTAIGFGGGGSNQLGDSFTVSAWYNLDTNAASGASRFFVFEGETDYDISYGLRNLVNANGFNDTQTFTNGIGSRDHADVHTPGTWQHVLMTYESVDGTTTITTYIDGEEKSAFSGATSALVSGGIHIGNARNGSLNRAFDGKIDEFAAWSRVLVSGEIAAVRNAGMNGERIDQIQGFLVNLNSANPSQGVAIGSGFFESGSEAPISAESNPGYVFSQWTGDFAGQPDSFVHTVVAAVNSTAEFGPDLSDPDGDNLSTYDEVIVYGTNPNDADSDGDQIPDDIEIASFLDPNVDDSALVALVDAKLCPNNAGAIAMSDLSITRDSGTGEIALKLSFLGSVDQTTWTPIVLTGPAFSITPVLDGWEITLPAPSDTVDSYILLGNQP